MAAAAQYIRVSLRPKMLEKKKKKITAMKKVKQKAKKQIIATTTKKIERKILHSITTII